MLKLLAFIASLLILVSNELLAQHVESRDSAYTISDVTVTARKTTQSITAPMPIQSISGEELETLGFQNIADAVRRFAGAQVKDYGGVGGLKTVSIRSLGAAHTGVAYDGVPVSNAQMGQIDIGRFALDEVETLTLSIGHDNNLLQPAQLFASAGFLSIYSKNPLSHTAKKQQFKAQVKAGSFGTVNPFLSWRQRISKRTHYSWNGNLLTSHGEYPFTLVNVNQVTEEKRTNTDITQMHTEANLFHSFKDSSRLQLKAYYFYSNRGLPGSIVLYNDNANERLWDKNGFVQAQYHRDHSSKWSTQLQAKYNYTWNRYRDFGVQFPGGKKEENNTQQEYYLSTTTQWKARSFFSASFANDLSVNHLDTDLANNPFPTRLSWISAINARLSMSRLTALATLVHTYITERVEHGPKPDDRTKFSPTLSLRLQPLEDHRLYLRAMYKNTFRVPTFNDLYYTTLGNSNLRPETATEYNVGIAWDGEPFRLTDYVSITVDGYINRVNDKIVAIPGTYQWKMMNFGTVHITGFDATMRTSIPLKNDPSGQFDLALTANYTYQKAIDMSDPLAKSYKHQLPYTPKHHGNLSALLKTPWCNLGYTLTTVSDRYSSQQNIESNLIDGYTEHGLTLSRTLNLSKFDLRLQLEAINFTNESYDIIRYYPMPGRSFRATVSLTI